MFLETFINKTIDFYNNNHLCWIRKQNLFVTPTKVHKQEIHGKLKSKNDVDYYGIYKGIFVCFEAKQTIQPKFLLSNIKEHQWKFLENISLYGGISFLILSFLSENVFYAISFKNLQKIKQNNIKSLNFEIIQKYGFKLEIKLPGIIDIISFLENQINEIKLT